MFQLSKKVEYGLIAIRHMASGSGGQIFTAKEISDKYQISHDLLAKVMQKLAGKGYIASYQGVHGGYTLTKNPNDLKVSNLISAIEGKSSVALVQCETGNPEECAIRTRCTIKIPLVKIQNSINKMFDEMTIMEMF